MTISAPRPRSPGADIPRTGGSSPVRSESHRDENRRCLGLTEGDVDVVAWLGRQRLAMAHVRQVERIEELRRQLDEAVDRYHDALLGLSAANQLEATVAQWLNDECTTDRGIAAEVECPFRVVDQP